jgi:protein-L-isoaspartate O-methyltransferase
MSRPIDVEAFHAFEAAGWEARAATYGEFVQRVTEQLAAPVLGAANVGPGTSVLDVGTGPGAAGGAAVVGCFVIPVSVKLGSGRRR